MTRTPIDQTRKGTAMDDGYEFDFDADGLPKRNPVYCTAVDGVLDLDSDDLGHPEAPGLWQMLLSDRKRPVPERGLFCPTCIRSRPSQPEWMYVYERQDGLKIAVHNNPSHNAHANESDEHLAYKERIAAAAQHGGYQADLEVRTADGKARSDVRVIGANGQEFGFEPQLRYSSAPAIRKRDRVRRDRGISPFWHVVDPYHPLINNAAWGRTDSDLPASVIRGSSLLEVRGGVYQLLMEKCDRFTAVPCPVLRTGRCGQYHPTWKIKARPLDQLVCDIAAGEYVSVVQKFGRFTRWFWTPATDRQIYLDAGGELLQPEREIRARLPRQSSGAVGERDVECTRDRSGEFQPGPKQPPRDGGETFRPVLTLSSMQATGRPAARAADLAGGEVIQLARELGCSSQDIGPCARCSAPIARYGDKARGTLCMDCKALLPRERNRASA